MYFLSRLPDVSLGVMPASEATSRNSILEDTEKLFGDADAAEAPRVKPGFARSLRRPDDDTIRPRAWARNRRRETSKDRSLIQDMSPLECLKNAIARESVFRPEGSSKNADSVAVEALGLGNGAGSTADFRQVGLRCCQLGIEWRERYLRHC